MIAVPLLIVAHLWPAERRADPPEPPAARVALTGVITCSVAVREGSLSCTGGPAEGPGGVSLAVSLPPQPYDSIARVYRFDVRVRNESEHAAGTPDGETRTGLKVFVEAGPYVTAYRSPGDTGSVTISNADGVQNFTAASQPYFFHDTILAAREITTARRWEMRVPRTVDRFGFAVRVFTATPREQRVPSLPPDSVPRRIYNPQNYEGGAAGTAFLRDVAIIRFTSAATDEERQSAVDMIKGRVVGGIRYTGGDGEYYIRITHDGTAGPLLRALDALKRLPQVEYAVVEYIDAYGPQYLLPDDPNPGGRPRLDPDSADGLNCDGVNVEGAITPARTSPGG